jgi:plastocyanin
MKFVRNLVAAALLVASPAAIAAGGLEGFVRYAGKVPPQTVINKAAPPACGTAPVYDETIVAASGRLANVVITIEGAAGAKAAPRDIVLDQKGCRYEPHVLVAPVGSKLTITNSDDTLHTAHAYHDATSLYNIATPTAGMKMTKTLDAPGPISFKCDAGHTWMAAWVVATTAPYYAVSKTDGTFAIPDLPPGSYTVKAWHEKLGEKTAKVTIPAGGKPASLTIDFK